MSKGVIEILNTNQAGQTFAPPVGLQYGISTNRLTPPTAAQNTPRFIALSDGKYFVWWRKTGKPWNVTQVLEVIINCDDAGNILNLASLELFRQQNSLPNATFDDMLAYYVARKSVMVIGGVEGTIVTHNLVGRVLTKFVDNNGNEVVGVWAEYLTDNTVTLHVPVLDEINTTYTGKLLCEKI